ncbi:MAG: acylphosphatase [Bryobacteraceae bacterium]|nr:acylphosphatase [Bryobacteraceae bacterium]
MAQAAKRTALRFIVRGRVQGVGYRSFAEKAASVTGVSGWARNRDDGTVEAVACGTKSQLDAFAGYLHQGPRWGEVRSVEVTECELVAGTGFTIRH